MAHLLPCDADGVCMRCKVHPPDSDVILCDSCSSPWHMACLDPPLDAVPAGNWSCPDCSDLAPGPAPSIQPGTSSSPPDMAADGAAGPASLAAKVRALQEDTSLDERERARLRQKLVIEHGRETALANGKGAKGKARGQASPGMGRSGSKRKADEVEEGAEKAEEGGRKGDARVEEEEEEEEESELKQAMKCGVCLETVDRPITTPCGHNCCLKCFTKWVGQGNKKCPKCRALIPPRMIANPRINSALVAAIRFANAAKANKGPAGPSTPGHYKPLANEQRPDEAFVTERAKKTGKANACSGRIFVTIPPDHFGPITAEYDEVRHRGVLVGDNWADRLECRQWGAHFPHVAGIAGQSDYGAQSVALSGGYEDDEDNGEWFLYTGSGGRDLSGNKRTNKHHSFDQTFTAANEALRVSCIRGYPVRVVRSHKEKRSSYAPEEGVRYDGVYRIERCWRKKGAGGFLVCRYLFVRCDNEAAPWTSEEHGDRPRPLPEIEELKDAKNLSERKGKAAWDWNEETEKWEWVSPPPSSRKMGTPRSASGKKRTSKTAHKRLLKDFGCSLCKKVLTNPVSTPCAHNFCKACLEKKFAGTAVCRERGPSGRALRVQKVVKDCPAPQCTNDLAEFLTTMKVNLEMVDIIDLLRKKAEEEKKAAEEGKEEGEEGEDGGEGEEAEGGGEEEGAGTQEGEEEEDEEGDIREVKAEAGLAPEVHEAKDLSNGVQGAQESHGVEEEVNGVKEEVNGVKEEVNGVKEEVNGVKEEVDGVKEGTDGVVEAKVSEVKGRGRKRKSEGAPSGSGTGTGTGAGTTLKRCSNPKGTPPKATPPLRGRAAALANGSPPA